MLFGWFLKARYLVFNFDGFIEHIASFLGKSRCRVNFKLKSDTDLFEIAKCKTSVSAIEVLQLYDHISELIVDNSTLCYLGGF